MFFFLRFIIIFILILHIFNNAEEINNNATNTKRWNFSRRYRTTTSAPITTPIIIKNEIKQPIEENNFFTVTTLPTININITTQKSKITIPTTTTKTITTQTLLSNILPDISNFTDCGNLTNENIPWIVIIEHKDPDNPNSRKTLSKGVLISDKHVLTTVSSIHSSHPFWVVSGIRLNDPSTRFKINSNINSTFLKTRTIGIDKIYQHEDKDIAIIRMIENVNFTETIQPICLTFGENYNFRELYIQMCKKTIGNNGIEKNSELIPVFTLSPQDCIIMYNKKGAKISNQEFCAWDQNGDDCAGDIGGPLMAKYSGKYLLVGLTSYAITDQEFDISDYPGVYVNVGSHLQWIKKILKEK